MYCVIGRYCQSVPFKGTGTGWWRWYGLLKSNSDRMDREFKEKLVYQNSNDVGESRLVSIFSAYGEMFLLIVMYTGRWGTKCAAFGVGCFIMLL